MAVKGLRETLAAFTNFERDARAALRQAVTGAVDRVYAEARARCPVGEGSRHGYVSPTSINTGDFGIGSHVRDQIRKQMVSNEPMGAVFVERRGIGGRYGTDNVALWLEYGTKERRNKRGADRGKVSPRPFMGPAAETERAGFNRRLEEALERAAKGFN